MTAPAGRAFPAGFVWGVATSAYQIEGAAAEDGKGPPSGTPSSRPQPGRTRGGATSNIAVDRFIATPKTSTSWPSWACPPTASPPPGRASSPPAAARPTLASILRPPSSELLAHHIEPYLTLFHYDLPQALQDVGGSTNSDTAYRFADYAR